MVTANLAAEQISRCFCICQGFPRAQKQTLLWEREVKAPTRAGLGWKRSGLSTTAGSRGRWRSSTDRIYTKEGFRSCLWKPEAPKD